VLIAWFQTESKELVGKRLYISPPRCAPICSASAPSTRGRRPAPTKAALLARAVEVRDDQHRRDVNRDWDSIRYSARRHISGSARHRRLPDAARRQPDRRAHHGLRSDRHHHPDGQRAAGTVGGWSTYRLVTRSRSRALLVVDFLVTVAVCLAVPLLVEGPDFHLTTARGRHRRHRRDLVQRGATGARLAADGGDDCGGLRGGLGHRSSGGPGCPEIFNLYYFAIQWAVSCAMRTVTLRVGRCVDAVRHDRCGRRDPRDGHRDGCADYDREQTRLLHDTVASTLDAGRPAHLHPAGPARRARPP
jgi:hypothetical protein